MAQHTESAARSRLVTYDKNICPQCSAWLLAPEWSEHVSERSVRHSWSCHACGYGFETAVFFPRIESAAA
jgi:ribosomal protein L37AE/L43A